jgi:aspartyl-tRNA(Asn)/glutamyl-tRNA(Gln) amidotransferase subunit A
VSDPLALSLTALAAALRARTLSSVEIVQAQLARLAQWQPVTNAFVAVEADEALAAARRADAGLAAGHSAGPLHGVPLAHKDMYYSEGKVAGCGSLLRQDWVAPVTSTVIARLEAAGTFRIGRLHMSEFAYGPTGHNSSLGHARNPWNPRHITGGSSSGSGVAVATRVVAAALGSDTGGSIRGPAHFCGVTGLKPTYGRVSRANAMPLSFTLDTVGPLARSAEDCGLIAAIIAGPDALDPTTAQSPLWNGAAAERSVAGLTVGVPDAFYVDDLDPDVAAALDGAIETLRKLGAQVRSVSLPDQNAVSAAALVIIACEATSYHAPWLRTRAQDYGAQVRARLENGLGYSAVEYLEALRWRGPALQAHLDALRDVDVVLAPVSRRPAPTIAETDVGGGPGAEAAIYGVTRLMRTVNYLGLPALAVPAGFSQSGLPIGLQLIGRPYQDETVIALGRAFQSATDFHERTPTLPTGSN